MKQKYQIFKDRYTGNQPLPIPAFSNKEKAVRHMKKLGMEWLFVAEVDENSNNAIVGKVPSCVNCIKLEEEVERLKKAIELELLKETKAPKKKKKEKKKGITER